MPNRNQPEEKDFLQYVDIIKDFCADVSQRRIVELFQVTDGKKIGTYIVLNVSVENTSRNELV